MFVSNDGDSLVVAYDGMNLVPVDASMALEVLRFYHRGNLVRAVSLGDLYIDRSQLKRTISHLAWVRSIAVNGANQLDIELIGGSHKKISMK